MIKKAIFKSTLLAITLMISGSIQAQINLDDCQQKARTNYPLILQFDLIEQSKEYSISNANKAYLPQLDITVIGGIIDGLPSFAAPGASSTSSSDLRLISIVQVNQVIWDGGATKSVKMLAEANAKTELADVEVNLHALKQRVNGIYFGILLIDEQLNQLQFVKTNLSENLTIVEGAFANGAAYEADVNELKVELLNLDQQITELNYNRSAYCQMLSLLIGEKIEENQEFPTPLIGNDISTFEINRPELDLFKSQEEAINSKTKLDRSKVNPKFGLMGFGTFVQPGVGFGQGEISQILVAGLSLSWQLSSLYRHSNNKKMGELNLNRINNQRETFIFSTNLELTRVEKNIEKYRVLLERDEQLVKLKKSIKDSYQSKYNNGVIPMSELLIRINDEKMAKQNFVTHEIQYLMALYEYKTTSGN